MTAVRRLDDRVQRIHREQLETDHAEAIRSVVAQIPRWPVVTPRQQVIERMHPRLRAALDRYRPEKPLLVCGPSGTGKTSFAALVAKDLTEKSHPIESLARETHRLRRLRWALGHDLVRARREQRLGDGDAEIIETAKSASILFLDELGAEPMSEIPFEIVLRRGELCRPTLVTSGLKPAQFRARYGDAMHRRLTEQGVGACIDLFRGGRK